MSRLGLYWHTARYLKPVQVYGRLRFRLARPAVDLRPAPATRTVVPAQFVLPAHHHAALIAPDRFRFLGEEHALDERGWDDPALDKLWRYNLHYFDDLTAADSDARRAWHEALLARWVRENPPAVGTGWEPYPTSLRIVNWVKWALAGNPLPPECRHSLAVQARWLRQRLERHLLGNHLFANAKALVFVGLYFEGAEADGWVEAGLRLLAQEIPEQILSDGGQFERSPMYHALALEDMLDLVNVLAAHSPALPSRAQSLVLAWRSTIDDMRHWMLIMTHPDGEIGFFNDAAIGIAPAPVELERYAARLGFATIADAGSPVAALRPSGYIRVRGDDAVALLDVAPIGPDYLPAHAHADTLSFELSLFGHRLFVNSGTSRYGAGPERLRQRRTAAHNTVVIDDQDSSEVWGGFRVARRARPIGLRVIAGNGVDVKCGHDGYARLPGSPIHTRRWVVDGRSLTIDDDVSGTFSHADARFHLHPAVRCSPATPAPGFVSAMRLGLPEGQEALFQVQRGDLRVERTSWHPEFGIAVPNECLVVRLHDAMSRVRLDWSPGP